MSLLVSETEVAAAEGDIASMRFHIGRLPPGLVRTRLLEALGKIEAEVSSSKSNLQSMASTTTTGGNNAPNDFVVVEHMVEEEAAAPGPSPPNEEEECCENEVAREARQKLERALTNREAASPRSSYEAAALCIHALLASKAEGFPGLRCIGVPSRKVNEEQPKTSGFAAPVRELEPGKLVPPGWNDQGRAAAFKYRRATFASASPSNEVIELRCVENDRGSQRLLGLAIASSARGELHADDLAVEFEGTHLPCARFDELADYVRDVVAPRLAAAPAEKLSSNLPPPPPYEDQRGRPQASPFRWAPPPPLHPPPPPPSGRYPLGDEHEFVGPSHPIFGGGDSSVSHSPRFDPIIPGDGPRTGPVFPGGQPPRPNKPRLPGEPNFDHLKPPGDGDDSMFL